MFQIGQFNIIFSSKVKKISYNRFNNFRIKWNSVDFYYWVCRIFKTVSCSSFYRRNFVNKNLLNKFGNSQIFFFYMKNHEMTISCYKFFNWLICYLMLRPSCPSFLEVWFIVIPLILHQPLANISKDLLIPKWKSGKPGVDEV